MNTEASVQPLETQSASQSGSAYEWKEQAACRNVSPEERACFFPINTSRVNSIAKAICDLCTVGPECETFAKSFGNQTHGIWNGKLFVAGKIITEPRSRRKSRSPGFIEK